MEAVAKLLLAFAIEARSWRSGEGFKKSPKPQDSFLPGAKANSDFLNGGFLQQVQWKQPKQLLSATDNGGAG